MSRKTPKALAEVLMVKQPAQLEWTEQLLRTKDLPLENQMPWLQKMTKEEIVARMDGYNTALEDMLHSANCYAGFNHYGPQTVHADGTKSRTSVRSDDPEYRGWRRLYYSNGVAKT